MKPHQLQCFLEILTKKCNTKLPLNITSLVVHYFLKKITLQVAGLDKTVSAQQCIDYLNEKAGEVKYFRFCTRAGDPVKYALAEFSDRAAVINALKLNGQVGR